MVDTTARFFIALVPPPAIQDYANGVIQELGDRFQTHTAKAPPHVTLQPPFEWSPARADRLTEELAAFAQRQSSVPVHLLGFGQFSPRVLYIHVERTPALLALQAALAEHLEQTLGIVDPKAKRRRFTPHITVASRNITPYTFQQAWALLKERPLDLRFSGDRLTLLKHDGHEWQIYQEFALLTPARPSTEPGGVIGVGDRPIG
ncbi:2'-5' RNA ligase family protein [Thermoleptolyngbya oregonensis NK1-22]|uniref:2'-5' RNA ligase family protein n=1 Tax=Thermoleptolyngbya oregonensis NK1-22 TaxID=2547457 RepID=A0AA96Y5F0_9CYAN|nr:2'-5' RNA ligase family protein [Thermoleptolyngbya oregonensis NK1-22]